MYWETKKNKRSKKVYALNYRDSFLRINLPEFTVMNSFVETITNLIIFPTLNVEKIGQNICIIPMFIPMPSNVERPNT